MSDEEILEKAIRLAVEGGWKHRILGSDVDIILSEIADTDMHKMLGNSHYSIIFNKEFAKALWGEEHDCGAGYHKKREIMHIPAFKLSNGVERPAKDKEINLDYVSYCIHGTGKNWQYHLQMMVIADNPIKYLGENLGARK